MWWGTAIEAPDPALLARFYAGLLEWPIAHEELGTAVVAPPQGAVYLVFQEAAGYRPPTWPPVDGEQRTMMHLDFQVAGLDATVAEVVGLGAVLAPDQPQDNVRVLFDPTGHPFCLCRDDGQARDARNSYAWTEQGPVDSRRRPARGAPHLGASMTVESIPVKSAPRSLAWDGDELVSATGGGRRWGPDGVERTAPFAWSFPFDAGTASASGRYSAVYQERGTKAVLLGGERTVRELNRSYYHAPNYDYPLALGALGDGREVVVHCPDEYNVLQIEDAASGERLTAGGREPEDVFHSRLSLSPDGRYLLSVGWVWQPFGMALVYDTALALSDPGTLDGEGLLPISAVMSAEVTAGCWLDTDRLVLATGAEEWDEEEAAGLPPRHLGVWSVSEGRWLHRSPVADVDPGVLLLPRGDQVISFLGHPRLLDPATGRIVAEWPEVAVPVKPTCFGYRRVPTPVAALHPDGTRLAVATAESIALITLP